MRALEQRRRAIVEALRAVAREPLQAQPSTIVLPLHEPTAPEDPDVERVAVPAVPLGEGRMSAVAARALFGD